MSKRVSTNDDIKNDDDPEQIKVIISNLFLEEICDIIKQGDIIKLTDFIDDGGQFNKNHKCHKYFYYACEFGKLECAQILLTRGQEQELYLDTEQGLFIATKLGHIEIVQLIINSTIQSISIYSQYSAFCLACRCGHLEMVKLLQNHYNFNINMRLKKPPNYPRKQTCRQLSRSSSPLVDACQGGSLEVVRFLIDNGANVVASGTDTTPLNIACVKGYLDIVKLIIATNPDEVDMLSVLPTAARLVQVEIVRELLIHIYDQYERDDVIAHKLPFCLIEAVDMGHNEMVSLLIDSGADVNIQAEGLKETALYRACKCYRISTARILLSCGADVNNIGKGNMYILHSLFDLKESVCIQMIKLLFEYNVNVDVICLDTGDTALIKACDMLYYECIQALLAYGADVNLANRYGVTALLQACMAKNEGLVRMLLEYGADVTLTCKWGRTAVELMTGEGSSCEAIRALCEEYWEANSKRGYVCK